MSNHDKENDIEYKGAPGHEDQNKDHESMSSQPEAQEQEIMLSIFITNCRSLMLKEVSGTPGHVMIIADHVDLNHVEEGVVFEQVEDEPKEVAMDILAEVPRLDQEES